MLQLSPLDGSGHADDDLNVSTITRPSFDEELQ